jgi:hypothetical protein
MGVAQKEAPITARKDNLRATAVVTALALVGSGCSYAFVDGPPKEPPQSSERQAQLLMAPPTCSTSYGWPVVDTVLAAAALVPLAYILLGDNCGASECSEGVGLAILALAAPPAWFGGSASVGYRRVHACRAWGPTRDASLERQEQTRRMLEDLDRTGPDPVAPSPDAGAPSPDAGAPSPDAGG